MHRFKKLLAVIDEDRNWAIVMMLAVFGAVVLARLHSPAPLWTLGWWFFYAMSLVALASIVGLIWRKEWSRYGCLLIGAMLLFVEARGFYNHGFTLTDVAGAIIIVVVIHRFWKMPITHDQLVQPVPDWFRGMAASFAEMPDVLEDPQIIILLREPVTLDVGQLAHLARRAYGRRFEVFPNEFQPVDALLLPNAWPKPFVACEPSKLLCFFPPYCLTVSLHDTPHPAANIRLGERKDQPASDDTGAAEAYSLDDWGPAFGHQAALEIRLRSVLTDLNRKDPGYAHTAKLVAELIDDRCLGLYLCGSYQAIPISAQVIQALRSDHPAEALQLVDQATA
jgi:hypothetical protein